MNMRELDLTGFGTHLTHQDKPVAPVSLKNNNDLSLVSQKMVEYCMTQIEANPGVTVTPELVTTYLSEYQKEESAMPHFATLEKFSGMFAHAYKESLAILKNHVLNDVNKLSATIESYTNDNLKSMGVEILMEHDDPPADGETINAEDAGAEVGSTGGDDNKEWDWDEAIGDTSTLLYTLADSMRLTKIDNFDPKLYPVFMSTVNFKLPNMNITPETRLEMIRQITSVTRMDSSEIEPTLDIVTDNDALFKFRFNLFSDMDKTAPFHICQKFSAALKQHYALINRIGGIRFNLSDDTYTLFVERHIELAKMCDIMRYYLVCRRDFFKHSLVLDNKILNKDVVPEFHKHDGTAQDIRNHMKLHYLFKKKDIPFTGVILQGILDAKDKNAEAVKILDQQILSKKREFKHEATMKAFGLATQEYLRATNIDMIPKTIGKENFIAQKMQLANGIASHIHNFDGNIEDGLYQFVIGCFYANTPVDTIYQMYTRESVMAMEGLDENEVPDVNMLEASVCSKMLSKFLVETFCK